MIKILLSLILLNNLFSCTPQVNNKDYVGEWLEVKHQNNEFVIVKCDYDLETLKVSQNSIFEHGVMEDTNYKIFSVKKNEKVDILFTDNNKKSYFKFYWIDKQKGIAKWQIVDGNNLLDKYFVLKAKSKEIKSLKGTSINCITNSDANNNVNDSLILNNNIVFYVENDNCILLKNKKNKTLLENCFDGTNVRIRNVSKEFIPLTFISGQYLMDIDFYKVSDQWVSKEINYYNSSLKSEIKNTKNIAVSLKDFNFNSIKEKFISKTIH